MDVKQVCEDLKELNPLVKVMLEAALKDIKKKGVEANIVETYRPKERQYYLYGQGRSVAECIKGGVPSAKAKLYARSGVEVTWTLDSIHIKRKAVDVIAQRNGNAIWNAKDKDSQVIIASMIKYGFEAGVKWASNPDSPHYQVDCEMDDVFTKSKNTKEVTIVIQKALGKALNKKVITDGRWGDETTKLVNEFRKKQKWLPTGSVGASCLKRLLTYL